MASRGDRQTGERLAQNEVPILPVVVHYIYITERESEMPPL